MLSTAMFKTIDELTLQHGPRISNELAYWHGVYHARLFRRITISIITVSVRRGIQFQLLWQRAAIFYTHHFVFKQKKQECRRATCRKTSAREAQKTP